MDVHVPDITGICKFDALQIEYVVWQRPLYYSMKMELLFYGNETVICLTDNDSHVIKTL